MTNNRNHTDVIISGIHLELTDALKSTVTEKVSRLLNHENHIVRIKVDLEYNKNNTKQNEFAAKGHMEIHGPPMIAAAKSDDLYKSIDDMVEKLDRMLRRRNRIRKVKRKDKHEVDIPALLPKVASGAE
jgi:putative sigma-54 modulation protein